LKLAIQEGFVPGSTYLEKMENAEKFGFEGLEVMGFKLSEKLKEIHSALSVSKIKVSTVVSGYKGSLLGPDRNARETAIESLKELLGICASLGGVGVIIAPSPVESKAPDFYPLYFSDNDVWKKILIEECKIIGDYAEEVGAYVLLEPLNMYEKGFLKKLQDAVEICMSAGKEYVKIMADTFHMNIQEENLPKNIEKTTEYIKHIHLADSNRLLPGSGHTDFKSIFDVLKKIGYNKYMALECAIFGDPYIELPKCTKYLKSLI
jgi:sugar phosphate isomerase/epimerase